LSAGRWRDKRRREKNGSCLRREEKKKGREGKSFIHALKEKKKKGRKKSSHLFLIQKQPSGHRNGMKLKGRRGKRIS